MYDFSFVVAFLVFTRSTVVYAPGKEFLLKTFSSEQRFCAGP